MNEIPLNKRLVPYFKIALNEAKKSPCTRRQYGAVIVGNLDKEIPTQVVTTNYRVSDCCKGLCARDRVRLANGERVEVGAEVHAETAAIIAYGPDNQGPAHFILAGQNGERELLGTEVYPCHTCAMNLKWAGFRWIFLKDYRGEIIPVSVSEILTHRESEWDYDV